MARKRPVVHNRGRVLKKKEIEMMAQRQSNSFEPSLIAEMKYRNAEDPYAEDNVEPLSAQEIAEQDEICENQRRLLQTALEPGGMEAQLQPFTGSVVAKVLEIAREAEQMGAAAMVHQDWMADVHEPLYSRHLPFSSQYYKIFRLAARGRVDDPDVVQFLILQSAVEKRRITKEQSDKLGAAHTAINHMYDRMRQDVEKARQEHDTATHSTTNTTFTSQIAPDNDSTPVATEKTAVTTDNVLA